MDDEGGIGGGHFDLEFERFDPTFLFLSSPLRLYFNIVIKRTGIDLIFLI